MCEKEQPITRNCFGLKILNDFKQLNKTVLLLGEKYFYSRCIFITNTREALKSSTKR